MYYLSLRIAVYVCAIIVFTAECPVVSPFINPCIFSSLLRNTEITS